MNLADDIMYHDGPYHDGQDNDSKRPVVRQ